MRNLILRIEAAPGSEIGDCATDAINLANRLMVIVMFTFNGVNCMACPGDMPESLESEFFRLLSSDQTYKLGTRKAISPTRSSPTNISARDRETP